MGNEDARNDSVGLYRQKALNGFLFGRSALPATHSQWTGQIKTMHQSRFPKISLRRSGFDRGPGLWGKSSNRTILFSHGEKEESKEEGVGGGEGKE
jgi:hypothetical protein